MDDKNAEMSTDCDENKPQIEVTESLSEGGKIQPTETVADAADAVKHGETVGDRDEIQVTEMSESDKSQPTEAAADATNHDETVGDRGKLQATEVMSESDKSQPTEADCRKYEHASSQGENDGQPGRKPASNHHRRKNAKRRKWKPYAKLTWEEKKALEERRNDRAMRIHDKMLDRGHPVAPYNTTQFIMAEHDSGIMDTAADAEAVGNGESSLKPTEPTEDSADLEAEINEYTDSPHMEPEFISQDFSEIYDRTHEENLLMMSKDDLVKEHLYLEQTLNYVEDQLANAKRFNNSFYEKYGSNVDEQLYELQKEHEMLVQENLKLRGEDEIHIGDGDAAEQQKESLVSWRSDSFTSDFEEETTVKP